MRRLLPPTVAVLAAASILAAAAPAAAQLAPAHAARIDSLFAEFDRPGSPGLAVAVVSDGRLVFERGYGYASLEHGIRITPTTVFDIASVSKQFTGLAIAMLVDQGRITLDDDIRTHIPELPDFGHTITIAHLVHHTSGLRDWPGALSVGGWRMDDVISFAQILRMAYGQRTLNFTPGAEYTYSNTGYNLLAEIVTRVSGTSFRAWTDAHLFRPLGMVRTHFHDDHAMVVADRAYGYSRTRDGFRAVTNNLTALGSSSLFSSVRDLAKWLANFEDPRVGGARAMTMTRTRGRLNDGTAIPYAFGIVHGEHRGRPVVNHSGSWAAFRSYLVHFPHERLGVVVLANTDAVNPQRAAYAVADLFLPPAVVAHGGAPAGESTLAGAPAARVGSAVLDRYVGVYRLGPGWYVRLRRDGDTLRARATAEDEVPLLPRSDSSFWVPAYGSAMIFARDSANGGFAMVYRGRRHPRVAGLEPSGRRPPADLAGDYESLELATSYAVEVNDTTVALRHLRHGIIPLTHAWGDDYRGAAWFVRSVAFQRDATGRVTGFVVNIDERGRNIVFVKRP